MKPCCAAYVNNSVCYQLIVLLIYGDVQNLSLKKVQFLDFLLDVDNVQRREYVKQFFTGYSAM